jgi:hypothetical protein
MLMVKNDIYLLSIGTGDSDPRRWQGRHRHPLGLAHRDGGNREEALPYDSGVGL